MGYFKHYLIFFPRPELIFDGEVEIVSVLLIFCQGLEKRFWRNGYIVYLADIIVIRMMTS